MRVAPSVGHASFYMQQSVAIFIYFHHRMICRQKGNIESNHQTANVSLILSRTVTPGLEKVTECIPICASGSSSAYTVDITSEYPKQCINEIEYNSTLLHDRPS
jgi:hypothetical protein